MRWYHRNSTYLSAILECRRAFIWAIWTHKTKRKTGNMADKYFSIIWYNSEGLLQISTLRKPPFFADFNIVWTKPYHWTRVRLPVFCKLWTDSLINLKFYARRRSSLKIHFDWYIGSNTHLRTRETLPLTRLKSRPRETFLLQRDAKSWQQSPLST